MPRLRTDAAERAAQTDLLVDRVASELGSDKVTIKQAAAYTKRVKGVRDITVNRIPQFLDDPRLEPAGVILGHVTDFKTVRGTTAQLSLITNAQEFGGTLLNAATTSASELLVVAMFRIPRGKSLTEDTDDVDSDDQAPDAEDLV